MSAVCILISHILSENIDGFFSLFFKITPDKNKQRKERRKGQNKFSLKWVQLLHFQDISTHTAYVAISQITTTCMSSYKFISVAMSINMLPPRAAPTRNILSTFSTGLTVSRTITTTIRYPLPVVPYRSPYLAIKYILREKRLNRKVPRYIRVYAYIRT